MTNTVRMATIRKHLVCDVIESDTIRRNYVCSACYGNLDFLPHPENRYYRVIQCFDCGENTRGIVTMLFIELKQRQQRRDYLDVARAYPHLAPPEEKRTVIQSLNELGFGEG